MGFVRRRTPAINSSGRSLQKAMIFQRKLNELPDDVSFDSKFCLTFQIQCFEILFFVVSKSEFFKEFHCKPLDSSGGCRGQNHLPSTHAEVSFQKTTLFQSKLNELRQNVKLASKFSLTFQIQYFHVSIFLVFKCQFLREFPYQMF